MGSRYTSLTSAEPAGAGSWNVTTQLLRTGHPVLMSRYRRRLDPRERDGRGAARPGRQLLAEFSTFEHRHRAQTTLDVVLERARRVGHHLVGLA